VKALLGASRTRHLGLGALLAALVASPALIGTPAQAMPAPGPTAVCLGSAGGAVPAARRIPDTSAVSAATQARVESRLAATDDLAPARSSGAAAATALPFYVVKVRVHVIWGTHKKERKLSRKGARHKVFQVLKHAYNGFESPNSESMGIGFRLKKITITKNDRWYHAVPKSSADRQMKRKLHGGTASTLNVYVNKPTFRGGGLLLGYSTFPWQYHGTKKKQDGVTINVRSLPGGSAFGYNLGDSVVHETGHWLGLFHTFQGGNGDPSNPVCDSVNDGVTDTPGEYRPNFTCSAPIGGYAAKWGTTVCDPADMAAHGYLDPAFNFMDYSLDACMRLFTFGQHVRVASMFKTYRAGR
jgi:hypothetical protein